MTTITVDTNIYVSAFNFGGLPLQLLEKAIAGDIAVVVSDAILAELRRVLRDKFTWTDERLNGAEALIRSFAQHVNPRPALDVIVDDPADNRVLECALASASHFIVTGDQDLLRLREYENIRIVRVSEFLRPAELPSG